MESLSFGLMVFIGFVMLLLGAIGGVLIGHELGEEDARNSDQESLSQALADVSERTTDDKAALEESLVALKEGAGACYAAVSLASEALDNRKEALDLEAAVPLSGPDAEWDAMYDQVVVLDDKFGRLAGRADIAAATCAEANEAANQSVGAVDFLE